MFLWWKKKSRRADDKVWATKELKIRGICEEVVQERVKNQAVFVLCHFEKALEELKAALAARNVMFEVTQSAHDLFDFRNKEGTTILSLSEAISVVKQSNPLPEDGSFEGKSIHVVVAEHYPIPERDEEVLSFAASLPLASTVGFHVSLDEPLLKMFGAESLAGLLKKLGWDETEFISHSMITSAIANVQKKIKKSAIGDQRVQSIEEWFQYNCPSSR